MDRSNVYFFKSCQKCVNVSVSPPKKYLKALSTTLQVESSFEVTLKLLPSFHFFSIEESNPVQFSSILGIRP